MSHLYYSLPLSPGDITRKKELPHVSLRDSIAQWIHLLAVTRFGECRHDETFGCEIWEHDFENIGNSQKYKDELTRSITRTITEQEPRLNNIKVEIQIEQIEIIARQRRIKMRISMKVRGALVMTNEPFVYTENFFVGPLSYA
jgi:predicted component of type VI protein secretion system